MKKEIINFKKLTYVDDDHFFFDSELYDWTNKQDKQKFIEKIKQMKEDQFVFDRVYTWRNNKIKQKIIDQLHITSKQKAFLLDGKYNRYLGQHFLGIKDDEIYLFNVKRSGYDELVNAPYQVLDTNIYQYRRLKNAKKFGIKSGILLHKYKFYPIDGIKVTKSGNMKIPADNFIRHTLYVVKKPFDFASPFP
jgi:hypothetical protein